MTETAIRAGEGPTTVIDVLDMPLAAVRGKAITGARHGVLLSFMAAVRTALVLIGR